MAKVAYGLGEHSTDRTVVSVRDLWHYSAKPQLKSYANGMPSAYSLRSGKGQMMLAPEVENFRMRFAASNANKPCVEFRWRAERECYQLDLAEGVLRRISGDAQVVLARGGSPWFAGAETPESWSAFEVAVQGGTIQVRVSKDGKTWEPGLNGVDKHPIGTGAVMLRSERPAQGVFVAFGDLQVVALPGGAAVRGRRAVGPEYREAFLTSMDYLPRDPDSRQALARIQALDHLGCLEAPVPAEVSTALAVAQSDRDLGIRLAALRASRKLGLALDVPRLLMAGLCSVDATVRVGSVRGLMNLKAAPEAIQSKVVDGLIADSRFVRFDMKRLVKEMGAPLRSAVLSEIQSRYAEAKSSGVKAALLRALGRDGADEKPLVEGLGLLTEALGDPAPEVRLAAVRTLRWIESPLAWQERGNVGETIFRGKPEVTSSITTRLKAMLERDPSLALRAEALGCLAEMRAAPGDILAALEHRDGAVRSAAIEGLYCFDRTKLTGAIPSLESLLADPNLKEAASAALSYIQEDVMKKVGLAKAVAVDPGAMDPGEFIRETSVRARNAAALSIAQQAERIPFPSDLLSHFSAQLCLKRNAAAANVRIQQELQCYAFGDKEGLDGTKLPLVYALHHSKSRFLPGGLTAETEALFKESLFSMVDWSSKAYFSEFVEDVMKLPGTENQSLQYRYGLWFMNLALLNEDPVYASRMLRGGKTVSQYHAEWNAFMKKWLRTRALNGFWIELGSGYSGKYSLPAIFAIYMGATDPETIQLTKMFIDLAMLEDAQASFGNVRGGSKNRIKEQGIYGTFGPFWAMLYEGKPVDGKGCHALASSVRYGGYELPASAVLMRGYEQFPAQPVLIANRRLGEVRREAKKTGETPDPAAAGVSSAPGDSDEDSLQPTNQGYVPDSKVLNYIWKTRHYMLGSMLRHPKTEMGILYRQRVWSGLVFANGKGLFPACPLGNPYFSHQHQNVLLLQRDKADPEPMSVFISADLEKSEENGWVFIRSGNGYAGIKIIAGGYSWRKGTHLNLVPEKQNTPILIQGGDADAFGSFEDFKARVTKNTLSVGPDSVQYSGPQQPRIDFFYEPTGRPSLVDGKPLSLETNMVYSSPYLMRKEGESIVRVRVGGEQAVYDFEKAAVTREPLSPSQVPRRAALEK